MPVTAKLSRKFYETFGDEIANELVEWFNQVDAAYRADLRELNELNFQRFDARLEQRLAQQDARWEGRLTALEAKLDKQQGGNAWLTVGLREGKNREIRKLMEYFGLKVNRLIRISYGPFQLGDLKEGDVAEVTGKVLREQLGGGGDKPRRRPKNAKKKS